MVKVARVCGVHPGHSYNVNGSILGNCVYLGTADIGCYLKKSLVLAAQVVVKGFEALVPLIRYHCGPSCFTGIDGSRNHNMLAIALTSSLDSGA